MVNFCVVFTKMNYSLKSDRHEYACVHIEVFHLICWAETISLSHDGENLLHVQHVICWDTEIVWPNFVTAIGFCSDEFPRTYWIFRINPVFLVFFCRDEIPRAYIQNCICLPSLKNWRCVLTVFFRVKFPCTWPICSTRCFENPRAFSTQPDSAESKSEGQVHRRRLCSCILFAIVLVQLVKLKFWEQQSKLKWLMLNRWRRLFCSSRVKFRFLHMSASWCFVTTYSIWISGTRLILSNNQSRATQWVLDACLIVGLRPFYYHLKHGFIFLKDIQQSIGTRMCHAWWNVIYVGQIEISVHSWNLFPHVWLRICRQVSPLALLHLWCCWVGLGKNETLQNPNAKDQWLGFLLCVNLLREKFSVTVELCETKVGFLHIQLVCTNVWLPKIHNVPPDVDFWVFKISGKIRVLKESQHALLCSVSHLTILFEFTRVMDVWDQTC